MTWARGVSSNEVSTNVDGVLLTAEPLLGTMKAQQREGFRTAKDIAIQRSRHALIAMLEPRIYHDIAANALEKMETRLHEFMCEVAGKAVSVPIKLAAIILIICQDRFIRRPSAPA